MSDKIMLVEDDQPILELMEILLARIGYKPLIVPDVLEALEIVKTDAPAPNGGRAGAKGAIIFSEIGFLQST